MIKPIPAPNLLLNFYAADQSSLDLFSRLARALPGWEIPREWRLIGSEAERSQILHSLDDGLSWLRAHPNQAGEVDLDDPLDRGRGKQARLSFFDYSPNPLECRVVRILSGGAEFSDVGDNGLAVQRGADASKFFLKLCEEIGPSYASITVEYEMESPLELVEDPNSLAFRDFFVAWSALGQRSIDRLLSLFSSRAYVAQLANGVFVSTSGIFNPDQIELGVEAQWLSTDVATILASYLGKGSAL